MLERSIVHMDLDAFFVSVECLRNKDLKGKPLIVGGHSRRGVVAACSYETRRFGVHSAMPIGLAKQLCPDALIISGDMDAYSQYSAMVTEIIAESSPLFEKSSIDEFYLDLSGMERFFGTYLWARELRSKIIDETGLPISMGLSVNKMVSKVATNEAKPNGHRQIMKGDEKDFLAPMPVEKIPMIGEKTTQFLREMGVKTVKTLREMPLRVLESVFGKNGNILWKRAHGIDNSPIVPFQDRKSISTETTFESDTIDVKKLKIILVAMVEKLAHSLRNEKRLTSCIAVKIRYSNFDTVSRQTHIPYTSSDNELIRVAMDLFDRLYERRILIRLIGVRMSKLVHGQYQIHLFDDTEENIRLYQAIDRIKVKHGVDKVIRASTMGINKSIRHNNNAFNG